MPGGEQRHALEHADWHLLVEWVHPASFMVAEPNSGAKPE
jgi:hypothetical protein